MIDIDVSKDKLIDEVYTWSKDKIIQKIKSNKIQLIVSTVGEIVLLVLGIGAPLFEELGGMSPDIASIYEKMMTIELAIATPVYITKVITKLKENKLLQQLLDKEDGEEIEAAEDDKPDKGMAL